MHWNKKFVCMQWLLMMICIVSLHMIISIIDKQVWYKHIADFYVNNMTLYWQPWRHLDKSSINIPFLICFARNGLFITSCISGISFDVIVLRKIFSHKTNQQYLTYISDCLRQIGRLLSILLDIRLMVDYLYNCIEVWILRRGGGESLINLCGLFFSISLIINYFFLH
jgi:hypothetical protein